MESCSLDGKTFEDTLENISMNTGSQTIPETITSFDNLESHDSFLCGVIEGFYGTPWTFNQRCHLITTLSKLKLNSYFYAPKNDRKHRKNWREMYDDYECSSLKSLITFAKSCGINFIYSLSPGIDISFSKDEDKRILLKKFEQLVELGCESFAILFDDIDAELSSEDSKLFESVSQAQSVITNEVYLALQRPEIFMFCPTEYCSSRAFPSLAESNYLKTIGTVLDPGIKIMWTGPRVVSKIIPSENIVLLSNIIGRPPVIWDNLHANDYDKCQIFLGPYEGRSLSLYPKLAGAFMNPNCQYDLNFIPIHTFSIWLSRSQMVYKDYDREVRSNLDYSIDVPVDDHYDPNKAMEECVKLWAKEFDIDTLASPRFSPLGEPNDENTDDFIFYASDSPSLNQEDTCNCTSIPVNGEQSYEFKENYKIPSKNFIFSYKDLKIITNFFYLPSKLGPLAVNLIKEFRWVKSVSASKSTSPLRVGRPMFKRLKARRKNFHKNCEVIIDAIKRVQIVPNTILRELLFPFVTEIKDSIVSMRNYVNFLQYRENSTYIDHAITEPETWIIKSRFCHEIQRLLPTHFCEELKSEVSITSPCYLIRPYVDSDMDCVQRACFSHMVNKLGLWDDLKPSIKLCRMRYLEIFLRNSFDMLVFENHDNINGFLLFGLFYPLQSDHEIRDEYEKQVMKEFRDKNADFMLDNDLCYPHIPESIYQNFPIRLMFCFQPGFRKSNIIFKIMDLILDKISKTNALGAHIIVDKFEFIEPEHLLSCGFEEFPDSKSVNFKYFVLRGTTPLT